MLYNIVLWSNKTEKIYQKVLGLDRRPLIFDNYGVAEREAHDKNLALKMPDENGLMFIVVEATDV